MWAYACFQFAIVILFAHVFYTIVRLSTFCPVLCSTYKVPSPHFIEQSHVWIKFSIKIDNKCRIVPKTNKTRNLQYIINLGRTQKYDLICFLNSFTYKQKGENFYQTVCKRL